MLSPRMIFVNAVREETHPDKVRETARELYHRWLIDGKLDLFVAQWCLHKLGGKSYHQGRT